MYDLNLTQKRKLLYFILNNKLNLLKNLKIFVISLDINHNKVNAKYKK
jgi:hypothetical protein